MKDFITVNSMDRGGSIRLISARPEDGENLRQWKNNNRRYFFYKDIISKTAQKIWMEKYFSDKNNFMFIVEYQNQPIGCMGFRRRIDGADIYNVILARNEFARKRLMSQALRLLCGFIRWECKIKRIYLKILKSNLIGRSWYERNYFKKTEELKNAFVMEFYGKPIKIEIIRQGE